jgi:hypothetical protein
MKVYPRILEISGDESKESFININNSSKNKVLLFKIRRSEPKVIDFQPKRGFVEAGCTVKVYVKLHANVFNARILVQLVAVKNSIFCNQFDFDWNVGYRRSVVKKVVYVQNNRANLDTISILSQDLCEVRPTDDNPNQNVLNTSQQSVLTVIKPELSLIKHLKKHNNKNENYLNDTMNSYTMNSSVISFGDYMSAIETAKKCTDNRDITAKKCTDDRDITAKKYTDDRTAKKCTDDRDVILVKCLNSSIAVQTKNHEDISLASQKPSPLTKSSSLNDEGYSHKSVCTIYIHMNIYTYTFHYSNHYLMFC